MPTWAITKARLCGSLIRLFNRSALTTIKIDAGVAETVLSIGCLQAATRHGFAPTACLEGPRSENVVLTEIDRGLLERCLNGKPRAWEDFVDRFLGLVVHVVNHTAQIRGVRIGPEDCDDLVAEVFLGILQDDFAVLRRFRGQSSLATYLTVVARRMVVRNLMRRQRASVELEEVGNISDGHFDSCSDEPSEANDLSADREQVERLIADLEEDEAAVVRMYHLEGKTYRQISREIGMPENSIGPILSRARNKMRRTGMNPASGQKSDQLS